MLRPMKPVSNNAERVGVMEYYMGDEDPKFGLICDGRVVKWTNYPKLVEHLNAVRQTGNPRADVRIPDCRGYFLRGLGGNSGDLDEVQEDAIVNITGHFNGNVNDGYNFAGAFWTDRNNWAAPGSDGSWGGGLIRMDVSRVVRTAEEVRPKNKAYNIIIIHGNDDNGEEFLEEV